MILWYARAVRLLQERDGVEFSNPACWRHLAEAHGTDIPRSKWPAGALWNECDHGSWFFLPWHRIYVYHFERIVRAAVDELGGPSDWALPYWNYSDASRPDVRKLPPAFRETQDPDGQPNPLFVQQRSSNVRQGGDMDEDAVSITAAFNESVFTGADGGVIVPGFGGAASGRVHLGQLPGTLEVVPHGMVHMQIGGVSPLGWMSRFETAGRDPIFWLHHANLDRLWESWLALAGGRANPTASPWASQEFELGSGSWVTHHSVAEMLDTTAAPLNYVYDELPVELAAAVEAGGGRRVPPGEAAMSEGAPPEMVGASAEPVPLGHGESSAEIAVEAPAGPLAAAWEEGRPHRVYLKLENVVGTSLAAGSYAVYLNLPDGAAAAMDHPKEKVGVVPLFGVLESSRSDEEHSGSGLSFTLDVTDAATELLRSNEGSLSRLRVTFAPLGERAGEETEADVKVGGLKLFFA